MSLQVQFLTLGVMLASGCLLGIGFDVVRVLSGQLRAPKWLISVCDLGYWIAATLFVFSALQYSNQGQLRMFVFLGLAIGILCYYRWLSVWTIKLILHLIRIAIGCAQVCVRLFRMLIVTPLTVLIKSFYIIISFLAVVSVFIMKIVIQLLYPFVKFFLWLFKLLFGRLPRWNGFMKFIGWIAERLKRFLNIRH